MIIPPRNSQERRALQKNVQKDKCRSRDFDEYASYFETIRWEPECTAATLLQEIGIASSNAPYPKNRWDPQTHKTPSFLDILEHARGGIWVDMGCGLDLFQAQFAEKHPALASTMKLIGVDFFDLSVNDILKRHPIQSAKEQKIVDAWERALKATPAKRIVADITAVELPEKADLITSVECIQYIDDKISAICHWHNQLKVGGIMMISTESGWLHWIRQHKQIFRENMAGYFLRSLREQGVKIGFYSDHYNHAVDLDDEDRLRHVGEIRLLVLQRTSPFELKSKASLMENWSNPHGYLASYYRKRKHLIASGQPVPA